MVPPPPDQICSPSSHGAGTEGSVESAIKRCVQSALERWTLESKTISSPPAEASASHIAGTSDYSLSSPHEAITQFPSTPSDIPSPPFQLSAPEASNPQLGSKRPVNHPLNALSGSADSTSLEPSSIRRKASIDTEPDEPASRVSRRSNKTDWEKFRPVLKRLYMKENLPLAEVIEIMKKNHHFSQT
ncbi:hypothetical protein F4823DRAFT_124331 [Ustulina deusta]|nr:hypothetical protein F4823DRAFT_124331 [Ustulina deusta]